MPGKFLLVSDVHFNPFYDPKLFPQLAATASVEDWLGILAQSTPDAFNPPGTDSNYFLLDGALADAAARLPDPDFILYPGDFLAHGFRSLYDAVAPKPSHDDPAAFQSFVDTTIDFVGYAFFSHFGAVPLLPTLGNDDSYCGDYMVEPEGSFLAAVADLWSGLPGPDIDVDEFRKTVSTGGYYTAPLPAPSNARLIVLNTVFFSFKYDNACGDPTIPAALDQLDWLEAALQDAATAGERVWLLMHIPPGINDYNTAQTEKVHKPAVSFWQPALLAKYLQIVERNPVIQTAFAGHTHMDDFRVIRLGGTPNLLSKIAPAISPIFGNNPGYQIYEYEPTTGTLNNYQTYYLSNLTTGGKPTPASDGTWELEYDWQSAYGLGDLSAASVAQLAENMEADSSVADDFVRYYAVSAIPTVPPEVVLDYRCALDNVTKTEYQACYDAG